MATIVSADENIGLGVRRAVRLSWGAIFGGAVVAAGVTVLLVSVGMAIGLSAINPANPSSARAAGMGTSIWTLIVPIIALFLGGLVAARSAGPEDRVSGALHGAVLWGLTTLIAMLTLGWTLGALGGLAARATGGAANAVAQTGAMATRSGGDLASALGVKADDLLAPVNRRLQAEGKPAVTARELESASKDAIATGLREGRLDREVLTSSLAEQTKLSPADANDVATRVEAAYEQRRAELQGTLDKAQTTALRAADATGGAMGWASLGLFLGLAAAVAGATMGVSRHQRAATITRPPLATSREAHV